MNLNYIKSKRSPKITKLVGRRVIACGGCGKKLRRFWASCDVGCQKPRHLHMWSHWSHVITVITCGDVMWKSKNIYFAECHGGHSTKYIFFFYFGPKFFCVALWQYLKLYSKIWWNFDFFRYISLIYFVSLIFSAYFKFELQVHGIMEFGYPKIDIHDI